jgi:hypothetical protein
LRSNEARSVDIRRRIDRVFARVDRWDDYGQLLARGAVVHGLDEVENAEAWRAAIRRQARADRIKITTGFNKGVVWAILARVPRPDERRRVSRTSARMRSRKGSPRS